MAAKVYKMESFILWYLNDVEWKLWIELSSEWFRWDSVINIFCTLLKVLSSGGLICLIPLEVRLWWRSWVFEVMSSSVFFDEERIDEKSVLKFITIIYSSSFRQSSPDYPRISLTENWPWYICLFCCGSIFSETASLFTILFTKCLFLRSKYIIAISDWRLNLFNLFI